MAFFLGIQRSTLMIDWQEKQNTELVAGFLYQSKPVGCR